jgi:hypothetical protein
MREEKPVRVNWGLRLLAAIGRAIDWYDRTREDLVLMWAHWRLLRRAHDPSPIRRALIAYGFGIQAVARADLANSSSRVDP